MTPPSALAAVTSALLLTGLAAGLTPASQPTDPADAPGLEQTIDPDQQIVEEPAVLDGGHVDIAPRFVDGEWRLLIHDDAARDDSGATSVWRSPDDAVFAVPDSARVAVPDDDDYAFVGVDAGDPAWLLPQTQDQGVVWVGWNTQEPEVMQRVARGVNFTMLGVEGPGDVAVYLQSGAFGAPEVLWSSAEPARGAFVPLDTHTHANWVFNEPGVHLVTFAVEADLLDGERVSAVQTLRFAVGDDASADDARSAEAPAYAAPGEQAETAADDGSASDDGLSTLVLALVSAGGLLLLVMIVGALITGRRARRSADAGDHARGGGAGS